MNSHYRVQILIFYWYDLSQDVWVYSRSRLLLGHQFSLSSRGVQGTNFWLLRHCVLRLPLLRRWLHCCRRWRRHPVPLVSGGLGLTESVSRAVGAKLKLQVSLQDASPANRSS